MRTTVTLDTDVEQILRARMARKGVSFKRALNDTIRESARGRMDVAFSTPTHDLGVPAVDLTQALRVSGDLEDADLAEKMTSGR